MRGRRPNCRNSNVVDYPHQQSDHDRDVTNQAVERAKALKPRFIDKRAGEIWDDEAPKFTHPAINRLRKKDVRAFALYCDALARYEAAHARFIAEPTYSPGKGVSGQQRRHSPAFAEMNAFLRQAILIGAKFGFAPHDDHGIDIGPEVTSEADADFG